MTCLPSPRSAPGIARQTGGRWTVSREEWIRTVLSAGSFLLIDFCLIFVPFGHYDEPEILRYAITSICHKGADVRQTVLS